MATPRTKDVMLGLVPNNSSQQINPVDMQDLVESMYPYGESVTAHGALGDGTTDDTNAIIAAEAAAFSNGIDLIFPKGTYKTTATIIIRVGVQARHGARINAAHSGVALQIGTTTDRPEWTKLFLPEVYKVTQDWNPSVAGSDAGVYIEYMYGCFLHVPRIERFTKGLVLRPTGNGNGIVNSTFILGLIVDNGIGIQLEGGVNGDSHANQNTFIGGVSNKSSNNPGPNITNTRDVELINANTNTFIGLNVEGDGSEYQLNFNRASYNVFDQVRLEASTPVVRFHADTAQTTRNNTINTPYDAGATLSISQSGAGTKSFNVVNAQDTRSQRAQILQNITGSANPIIRVHDSGQDVMDDADDGNYRFGISANGIVGKHQDNTSARIYWESYSGKLYWGDGSSGNTAGPFISMGTGTPEASVTAPIGSLYIRSDGGASTTFYVKESGTGNTGWIAK